MTKKKKAEADEVLERLQAVAQQNSVDRQQETAVSRISLALRSLQPHDQLVAIAAYQAALILEIAGGDRARATPVWQAAWHLSAVIIKDFHQSEQPPAPAPATKH